MSASASLAARVGKSCGLRVHVAKDNWNDAGPLCVVMVRQGDVVRGPGSPAATALQVLRTEEVDLVLVDMSLIEAFADAPAAEISAHRAPNSIVTWFRALPTNADADAIGVLRKPFTSDALIDLSAVERGHDPP